MTRPYLRALSWLACLLPLFVSSQCSKICSPPLPLVLLGHLTHPQIAALHMGRHHVRPCLWSRHVIVLAVANRSIFASINSSALPSLATLRLLHLSYNSFHDSSIPSNLTHLELSCSGFTSQIPAAAVARLTNLQRECWSEFGKPERASEPFEAGKTPSERGRHLTCLAQFHSLDLPPPQLLPVGWRISRKRISAPAPSVGDFGCVHKPAAQRFFPSLLPQTPERERECSADSAQCSSLSPRFLLRSQAPSLISAT